ncbi:MerR family transcriptional regulator [Sinomonas cellulolyticus]|uniref:MerR family transcriptional regulator n=1 Tax=Sinomonas cellulolyticus TaxID=2801916 RepID=A0ABS1K5E0_9MICC|nr:MULTISPECIES: MerR family transcriptional regulator [Sinomonas]MBL0706894.1 MerR family transcriptional regulator [Sinomonas cellulolyticus]GHG53051.1 MerR family transcriptional regulator [Sinomonas sp. KCTC 49339]
MEWSIQEVARLAGTTSRTLRHYGSIGLLEPSRTGHNGYRYYDRSALVRLQRILLLRQLGLGLDEIARVLARDADAAPALRRHLAWLSEERDRLARQARAVEQTISALETGGPLMAEDMFEGFDHTQYKDEVEERWGKKAYADSDAWWRGFGPEGQKEWQDRVARLSTDWQAAAAAGEEPDGAAAQALAARHVQWLAGIPGTPGYPHGPAKEYVLGLADMYVADPRFAKNYGGADGAAFVRDALHSYADREL